MNLEQVLGKLDTLSYTETEGYLEKQIADAEQEGDTASEISLLNEMIGFCRDSCQHEKSMQYAERALTVLNENGLTETLGYATTLLNIANAARAAGRLEESMTFYRETERRYQQLLPQKDMLFASLYNNWSLLYQEMNRYEDACHYLEKALFIVKNKEGCEIETAVTYTNLAQSLLKIKRIEEAWRQIQEALLIFKQDGNRDYHYSAALSVYAQCLFQRKQYREASACFNKAMQELEKHMGRNKNYELLKENWEKACKMAEAEPETNNKPVQETGNQDAVDEKGLAKSETGAQDALDDKGPAKSETGLSLCEDYFYQYGLPMLKEKFPEYVDQIAAGLVGQGSDCMGFDDETSRDHDWGPGFCIWVSAKLYEKAGEALSTAYEELPKEYRGYKRRRTKRADKREGVFSIPQFYESLLTGNQTDPGMQTDPGTQTDQGLQINPRTQTDPGMQTDPGRENILQVISQQCIQLKCIPLTWMEIPQENLFVATDGKVFFDPLGNFTAIRNALKEYYPAEVYRKKLAGNLIRMAQTGQYNYCRMKRRGDMVTAGFYLNDFMKLTLQTLFLLNHQYAPYEKWLYRAAAQLPVLPEITDILTAILDMDKTDSNIELSIEIIAQLIIQELKNQKLITEAKSQEQDVEGIGIEPGRATEERNQHQAAGDENYLEPYGYRILAENQAGQQMEYKKEAEEPMKQQEEHEKEAEELVKQQEEHEKKAEEPMKQQEEHENKVERLVMTEWKAFDKVHNEGGRASCQDDWNTFHIMRKSQYLIWTDEMIDSYQNDFDEAAARGWNLITEKYGRMEKSTAPQEYEQIVATLPAVSEQKEQIVEEIVRLQVGCMEEMAKEYPHVAGTARSIRTNTDTPYNTSYETYLRGELLTYSDQTLSLYGQFMVRLLQENQNPAMMIMKNTAILYGYQSLEELEARLI